MKAVYTALCFALLSVCSAAPLTCDQLLTTLDRDADFSGRWYLHAMSTDSCVLSNVMHTFLKPSIALDIVYQENPKSYEVTTNVKTLSFCMNETQSFFSDKTSVIRSNRNDESYHLLNSSCSDCMILKMDSIIKAIYLYSRKITIAPADLKEFETQVTCLGLPNPQVFNTDYGFESCRDFDKDGPTDEETPILMQRVEDFAAELARCLVRFFFSWMKSSEDISKT